MAALTARHLPAQKMRWLLTTRILRDGLVTDLRLDYTFSARSSSHAMGPSMNWKTVVILVLTLIAPAQSPQPVASADLVLTNGRVLTIEDALPEAQALAIK